MACKVAHKLGEHKSGSGRASRTRAPARRARENKLTSESRKGHGKNPRTGGGLDVSAILKSITSDIRPRRKPRKPYQRKVYSAPCFLCGREREFKLMLPIGVYTCFDCKTAQAKRARQHQRNFAHEIREMNSHRRAA